MSNNLSPLSPGPERTSTYPLDKLLSLWKQGELDADQMVGHLLQNLILLEKRLRQVEPSARNGAGSVSAR